jgi:predicted enzyme related to lactoylglutathione lyase
MHKSKLGGFIIDCRTDDLGAAAHFWGSALGLPIRELPGTEGDLYRRLEDRQHGLDIEVQKVDHPSRVHLDIETDDIEAEVRRLVALGAKRVQAVQTWVVMEAPTGQRFCVVRASSYDFERRASVWP